MKSSQNIGELKVCFSPKIVVSSSPKLGAWTPPQWPCVATSSAPAASVSGQAPFLVPSLVIQPACVCTVVGASNVCLAPSIRTVTLAPDAASAPLEHARTTAPLAPTRAMSFFTYMRATPFREGVSAWRSEAGLLAYGPTPRAFPAAGRRQWHIAVG